MFDQVMVAVQAGGSRSRGQEVSVTGTLSVGHLHNTIYHLTPDPKEKRRQTRVSAERKRGRYQTCTSTSSRSFSRR